MNSRIPITAVDYRFAIEPSEPFSPPPVVPERWDLVAIEPPEPFSPPPMVPERWDLGSSPTSYSSRFTMAFDRDNQILYITNATGKFKHKSVRVTYINTLINFKYELKKPIPVRLIREGNELIGEINELEMYSFGNDEFEVLKELNEEITELFEMLINIEDSNLGKYPKNWKSTLKQYIQIS